MEIAQRCDCHPKIQTAVILEKRPYLILLHFNYFSLQQPRFGQASLPHIKFQDFFIEKSIPVFSVILRSVL
jgi:hypothetical protein